jgi:hypothetical protein
MSEVLAERDIMSVLVMTGQFTHSYYVLSLKTAAEIAHKMTTYQWDILRAPSSEVSWF